MCLLQNWKKVSNSGLSSKQIQSDFNFYQKTSFQSRSYLVAIIKSYSIFVCWQNRLGSERATKVLRILLFVPITPFEYFDIFPKFLSYSCQDRQTSARSCKKLCKILMSSLQTCNQLKIMIVVSQTKSGEFFSLFKVLIKNY